MALGSLQFLVLFLFGVFLTCEAIFSIVNYWRGARLFHTFRVIRAIIGVVLAMIGTRNLSTEYLGSYIVLLLVVLLAIFSGYTISKV